MSLAGHESGIRKDGDNDNGNPAFKAGAAQSPAWQGTIDDFFLFNQHLRTLSPTLATWVDQDPLDIYDSNTVFKADEAFAHGGPIDRFLGDAIHISESHYRAPTKHSSKVYPSAVASYMRWCRIVERTPVGTVIDFELKASETWEHAQHLASMPLLQSMASLLTEDN
jgi:hypothetical protein